jgi:NAD(P)-dependent dehydrogenase (short-subunit alcohol dehydrogenase family)
MRGPEDDAGLAGKAALISGGGAAGDGNGRAAAIFLARAGAKVLVADGGVTLQAPERESQEH